MIDVIVGQLTIRAYDKVEVFDIYMEMKLPEVCKELSPITFTDLAIKAHYIDSRDLFERVFMVHNIFGDVEAKEIVQTLDVESVFVKRGDWNH